MTMNPIIKRIEKKSPYKILYPFFREFTDEVIERAYEIIIQFWDKNKFNLMGRHPLVLFGGAVYIAQTQLISEDKIEHHRFWTQKDLAKALKVSMPALRLTYTLIDKELNLGMTDSAYGRSFFRKP